MPAVVEVQGLERSFGRGGSRVRALQGIDLAVREGETVGLIGPNGAGKSTLFGCLLGFVRPDAGTIRIFGRPPDDLAVRAQTGWLPERLPDEGRLAGLDVLRLHHGLARRPRHVREDEIRSGLQRVMLPWEVAARPTRTYSKGQRQRLALALALIGRPSLLLLDEPTTGLDPAGMALLRDLLGELRAQGVTILFNSHDMEEVERTADRILFVQHGRVTSTTAAEAGSAVRRVLRLVLSAGADGVSDFDVAGLVESGGGRLLEAQGGVLRVAVEDDASAARVVRALVLAGLPVAEVASEQGRLERAFLARVAEQEPSPKEFTA